MLLLPCLEDEVFEEDLPGFLKTAELPLDDPKAISTSAQVLLVALDEDGPLPAMIETVAVSDLDERKMFVQCGRRCMDED